MADTKKTVKSKVTTGLHEHFFRLVKQSLPNGIGLPEELAGILRISVDGAYRRIRGETELTLTEMSQIVSRYPVNMDEIFGRRNNSVTFTYIKLTDSEENFITYLTRLHTQLTMINQFPGSRIYYIADEVPLFYSFGSRKLSEFKLFFWQRSALNIEKYQNEKFRWGIISQQQIDLATSCYNEYMKVSCREVWTDETVLTNLKQIKFYYDSGLLSLDDALVLMGEHRKLIEMVRSMAEDGRKNKSDQNETYVLYSSDVVLGTNCIYVVMGDLKYSYLSFNSINSLTTANTDFCQETETWVRNLEKKGTLISGIGEKQRYQFFNKMITTIDNWVDTLKYG
jgi:hypothetical protein